MCTDETSSSHTPRFPQICNYYTLAKTTTETQLRPFVCPHCTRCFTNENDMTGHMFLHTERAKGKLFCCEQCGQCFNWKNSLKRHLKLHSGERPHTCNICGKSFIEKNKLTVHLAKHCKWCINLNSEIVEGVNVFLRVFVKGGHFKEKPWFRLYS